MSTNGTEEHLNVLLHTYYDFQTCVISAFSATSCGSYLKYSLCHKAALMFSFGEEIIRNIFSPYNSVTFFSVKL